MGARRMFGIEGGPVRQGLAKRPTERNRIIDIVLQRRSVRQQQTKGDRPVGESGIAERPAEPFGNVLVEIKPALLDESHHAQSHDQLRDRSDPDRIVDRQRPPPRPIGEPGSAAGGHAVAIERRPGIRHVRRRRGDRRAARQGEGGESGEKSDHRFIVIPAEAGIQLFLVLVESPPSDPNRPSWRLRREPGGAGGP